MGKRAMALVVLTALSASITGCFDRLSPPEVQGTEAEDRQPDTAR